MEEAGPAILQAFPSRIVDRMLWGESIRSLFLCPADKGCNAVAKPATPSRRGPALLWGCLCRQVSDRLNLDHQVRIYQS